MADKSKIPDLSAKLERLKRGLIADTVKTSSSRYPSLKESQLRYSLKSGRFGAFDPLRRRSKQFRQAVSKYAPPYYFWHKEFINSIKRKPVVAADDYKPDVTEAKPEDVVSCNWCDQSMTFYELSAHKIKRCKKRYDFLGIGYYRCPSCKEGFLDDDSARHHIKLHFPQQEIGCDSLQKASQHPIVCRDQAKRKKWL